MAAPPLSCSRIARLLIPLIKGVVMNMIRRALFHVVTDGHDQLEGPIAELLKTLTAYGQPHPRNIRRGSERAGSR